MYVITVPGVNAAYAQGLRYICERGELQNSRAGEVLVAPTPVTIVYEKPQERVLFDPLRDANPVFHLMEALHMLAGRHDARWLDQFVKDFSSRFAEEDGIQHGAYGYRWRYHFDMEGGGEWDLPDQLDSVVNMLAKDPDSRRAVISMWDPVADLGANKKDLPCNCTIFLRVHTNRECINGQWKDVSVLDMMVCCRSGDFVWGTCGANAVHFSMLLEYLAGRIGVGIGRFTHVVNNSHIYTSILPKLDKPQNLASYPGTRAIGTVWDYWDHDLNKFMVWTTLDNPAKADLSYANAWFKDTAEPMFYAHWLWRFARKQEAVDYLFTAKRMAPDWNKAALEWMGRRLLKQTK
jgi:thymidylate synthase